MKKKIGVVVCLVLTAILTVGCVSKGTTKEVIKDEDIKTRTIGGEDMTEIELLKKKKILLLPDGIFESEENYKAGGKKFLDNMKQTMSIYFNNDHLYIKEGHFLLSNSSIESVYDPSQYEISYDKESNIITLKYIRNAVDDFGRYGSKDKEPILGKYYENVELLFHINEFDGEHYPRMYAKKIISATLNEDSGDNAFSQTIKYVGSFANDGFLDYQITPSSSSELEENKIAQNIESGLVGLEEGGLGDQYKEFSWPN